MHSNTYQMFKPFNNAIWQNQKQLFIKPLIPLRFDNTFSDRELHCLIKLHYNGLNKNKMSPTQTN